MAINLTKYKDKSDEVQRQAAARGAGGYNFFKPETGTTSIRLMPPWDGGENFEREIWMHWRIGPNEQSFVCPAKTPSCTNSSGVCDICTYVEQLRSTGEPADQELAEDARAKSRYYVNIIENEDPIFTKDDVNEWIKSQNDKTADCPFSEGDTKVKIFQFGPMVYEKLLLMFGQLQMDLTDLKDGYDILLTKSGKDRKTKYECNVHPQQRAVAVVGQLNLPDLDGFAKAKDLSDMQAALSNAPSAPGLPPQVAPAAAGAPAPTSLPPASALPQTVEAENEEEEEELPPKAKAKTKTKAKAKKAPEPEPETASTTDEEAPECFKDAEVFDQEDVVCLGGNTEEGEEYERCPFFQECGVAVGVLEKPEPAPKRRRRKAAKKGNVETPADALEQEMQDALS